MNSPLLTIDEFNVVQQLAQGRRRPDICRALGIRSVVLQVRIDAACTKLEVQGSPALIDAGYRTRALSLPPSISPATTVRLDAHQRHVLDLLIEGLSVKDMAARRGCTPTEVRRLARNPEHAITRAWQLGLLPCETPALLQQAIPGQRGTRRQRREALCARR